MRSPTDMFSAGVAVLGVEGLKTSAAVRPTLFHDVALATQDGLALETAEVLHVPVPAFCFRALIRKDDLRGKGVKRVMGSDAWSHLSLTRS